MSRVKKINVTFLATVFFYLIGSYGIALLGGGVLDSAAVRLILSQIILVVPAAVYLIMNRISLKDALRIRKIRPVNVLLLVVFSVCIWPLMSFINALSMLFAQNHIAGTIQEITTVSYPLSMLAVAVVPSLLEESVYRGIFYNEYRKVNLWKGILVSGLLFGMMHMNFNQFFYAFAMGMIFALVIEATDSILSSMLIHFIINGFSTTVTFLMPKIQEMMIEAGGAEAGDLIQEAAQSASRMDLGTVASVGLIAIGPTIFAVVLLWLMAKNAGRWEEFRGMFKKKADEENLISLPLLIGIGICVIYMFLVELS